MCHVTSPHRRSLIFGGLSTSTQAGIPSSPPVPFSPHHTREDPHPPHPHSPQSIFNILSVQSAHLFKVVFLCGYPAAAPLLALQGQQNAASPTPPPATTLPPPNTHTPPSSSHKCVPGARLGGGGSFHTHTHTHFANVLGYSPWPGRGWPEPGPPGPTPPDPSRCPRRIGTVGQTQDQLPGERHAVIAPHRWCRCGCVIRGLLAASAWYQGAQPHRRHQADQDDQVDPAARNKKI